MHDTTVVSISRRAVVSARWFYPLLLVSTGRCLPPNAHSYKYMAGYIQDRFLRILPRFVHGTRSSCEVYRFPQLKQNAVVTIHAGRRRGPSRTHSLALHRYAVVLPPLSTGSKRKRAKCSATCSLRMAGASGNRNNRNIAIAAIQRSVPL